MTIQDGTLGEVEAAVRPDKRSKFRCRTAPSRIIRAVFPAWHLLTSRDHVHLSNPYAAWEFDPAKELTGKLQEGFCYVFRATWPSMAYFLPDGRTALSMEQLFDPDPRYRYHQKSLICHQKNGKQITRHRWNGHDGKLEVLYRVPDEAVGAMSEGMVNDTVLLAKTQGPYAGKWELPNGAYDFMVTPRIKDVDEEED